MDVFSNNLSNCTNSRHKAHWSGLCGQVSMSTPCSLLMLNKLCSEIDSRVMLKRGLAVLLVLSWVILSGFDVLEDLDPFGQIELHGSAGPSTHGVGHTISLANNIIESADDSRPRHSVTRHQPTVHLPVDVHVVVQSSSKLHKLHHIFLI